MTDRYLEYQHGKTDAPRVCGDCHAVSGLAPYVPATEHTFDGIHIRVDPQSGWAARGEAFDSEYFCPGCAAKRGWVSG